ncbi:MAG: hypothetical protein Q8R76_08815 [Candidatus Omnitrophota bacterium]|nr:hypothetical protein [Candidatus Omnitrophota bacterium]
MALEVSELDPITADLILNLLVLVGALINYGPKADLIRKAPDPVAELLRLYPGLSIILDTSNVRYGTNRNGNPTITFVGKVIQDRLAHEKVSASA